jgi:hypothetical protein
VIARHRAHDELRWFAPQADLFVVFDNSAATGARSCWRREAMADR